MRKISRKWVEEEVKEKWAGRRKRGGGRDARGLQSNPCSAKLSAWARVTMK
jgi:hypothetical protein